MEQNIIIVDTPKATVKQIELLNKLLDSHKITDKMFIKALESKQFASQIIKQGLSFNPFNRFNR